MYELAQAVARYRRSGPAETRFHPDYRLVLAIGYSFDRLPWHLIPLYYPKSQLRCVCLSANEQSRAIAEGGLYLRVSLQFRPLDRKSAGRANRLSRSLGCSRDSIYLPVSAAPA